LLAGFVTVAPWRLAAADGPPADVLKKYGLKAQGPLYVLDGEAEAKRKLAEYRQIARKLEQAQRDQASVPTPQTQQAMIQGLSAQIGQLRGEIAAVGQQMGRMPRYRGRWGGYYNQMQNAELNAYRAQLNAALNEHNAMLAQVRGQKIDPKQKDRIDAEVKTLRDQRTMAARELEEVVVSTKKRYADLATNAEVQKALTSLGLTVKPNPQLGPTREFHEIGRLAEKLETDSGGSDFDTKPKAGRKPRRGGR
jgi:hypothetical protein